MGEVNYSLEYLQKAQTAVLTSASCVTLLVAVTPRMTELAQLEEFILLHYAHARLVYYTERVTEQVDFRALFICGYTIHTTLTHLPYSLVEPLASWLSWYKVSKDLVGDLQHFFWQTKQSKLFSNCCTCFIASLELRSG